jgi:hypothetical protein
MDTILTLIDATSTENDQKLQTGFNALDSCSNICNLGPNPKCLNNPFRFVDGMDECDTAAKVMECGKHTAPDIFEDIVNTVDLKTVVSFCCI